MAEDASGLKIPLGGAVAVVVAFLALANVIDFRVSHAALVVGPATAAELLALAVLRRVRGVWMWGSR
jgi:hypothetical protein